MADDWNAGLPSDDALTEAAYLVSRGVRAMALAGTCSNDPATALRANTRLGAAARYLGDSVIPFVLPPSLDDPGRPCGYASHPWVIRLCEWARDDRVPRGHRHEIVGMLLGYSPAAIGRHGELDAGEPHGPWPVDPDPEFCKLEITGGRCVNGRYMHEKQETCRGTGQFEHFETAPRECRIDLEGRGPCVAGPDHHPATPDCGVRH